MASTVIQWMLDTRTLWPEATQTKDLSHVASRAMSLLSPAEKSSVLRYHFLKDAKLSLASSLLKRLAISRFCHVSWPLATATPDARSKKPIFCFPFSSEDDPKQQQQQQQQQQPLVFNVSHQAGVVVLLAVHNPQPGTDVGVDIVCAPERRDRDHEIIAQRGWAHYVRIHEDVFCPLETQHLLSMPNSTATATTMDTDTLLDHFYALWCLREAYVKMTGEALLAPWLADLEMRNFAPPPPPPPPNPDKSSSSSSPSSPLQNALETTSPEIWFQNNPVKDVDMRLQRELANEYMICTAVKKGGQTTLPIGRFEVLELEDVLAQAEALNE